MRCRYFLLFCHLFVVLLCFKTPTQAQKIRALTKEISQVPVLPLASTFQAPSDVNSLAFSPDGELLAGGLNGAINLWTLDGKVQKTLLAGQKQLRPNMPIAVKEEDPLRETPKGPPPIVTSLQFSPDGKFLAGLADKLGVGVWSVADGTLKFNDSEQFETPTCFAWSPDGKQLAVGYGDKVIRFLDFTSGKVVREFAEHAFDLAAVAYSEDGARLVSVGMKKLGPANTEIKWWNMQTGEVLRNYLADKVSPNDAVLSQRGFALFSEPNLTLWDARNGAKVRSLLPVVKDAGFVVSKIFVSRDETYVLGSGIQLPGERHQWEIWVFTVKDGSIIARAKTGIPVESDEHLRMKQLADRTTMPCTLSSKFVVAAALGRQVGLWRDRR